ncbi:DeoR family transcriptional regulator [Nonomuraea turkmeniaca]|nr:DeoR family transcriptional regulator [Nonomuraea turkmeniaca]
MGTWRWRARFCGPHNAMVSLATADPVTPLGVTPTTVRRDLCRPAADGLVRAVHGGARVELAPPTQ